MTDVVGINKKLRAISSGLFSKSLNYKADFQIFCSDAKAGTEASVIIKESIGHKAILGGTYLISPKDALDDIYNGFMYSGDKSSHPNLDLLNSISYKATIRDVMDDLSNWITGADQVIGIWIKGGHPFYPVFWDYAFIIESDDFAYAFIGSSSD